MERWYSPYNVGNNILVENFISYLNEFVWTKSSSLWLEEFSDERSQPFAKYTLTCRNLYWLIREVKNKKHKEITYRYFKYQFCEF